MSDEYDIIGLWLGKVRAFALTVSLLLLAAACTNAGTASRPQTSTSASATSTSVATPSTTPTPLLTVAPTPTPAAAVPATPAQAPAPQAPPCKAQAPSNPWGYDFCLGSLITAPPGSFCIYFACIDNFWNGRGHVEECQDEMFSKSGGIQGSCSYHRGNLRPLYSH
jgi:hypothetical protein